MLEIYWLIACVSAELARRFGLTPEDFGENLRDNYARHEVEQDTCEPEVLAEEYIKGWVIILVFIDAYIVPHQPMEY